MREIQTYAEFWPYYLREHSQPITRGFHYFGTAAAMCVLIFALVNQAWWFILLSLVCGYFFAWLSHALVEHNRPATFTYPIWSLASDFKMLFYFLMGRMGKELEKAGVSGA